MKHFLLPLWWRLLDWWESRQPQDAAELPPDDFRGESPPRHRTPPPPPPPALKPRPRYHWILDNGHGKLTAGKRSPIFDDGETQFFEYEFNRDIVERIILLLDGTGVRYTDLVPDYETVGNILHARVARANAVETELPKRYLSIHANAAPAPAGEWAPSLISGVETWHFHGSHEGRRMALVFQRHLIEKLGSGWKNRSIKSRAHKQFYVLRATQMPAVLTENGFFNNRFEVQQLMDPAVRQVIARAHVEAILELEGRA